MYLIKNWMNSYSSSQDDPISDKIKLLEESKLKLSTLSKRELKHVLFGCYILTCREDFKSVMVETNLNAQQLEVMNEALHLYMDQETRDRISEKSLCLIRDILRDDEVYSGLVAKLRKHKKSSVSLASLTKYSFLILLILLPVASAEVCCGHGCQGDLLFSTDRFVVKNKTCQTSHREFINEGSHVSCIGTKNDQVHCFDICRRGICPGTAEFLLGRSPNITTDCFCSIKEGSYVTKCGPFVASIETFPCTLMHSRKLRSVETSTCPVITTDISNDYFNFYTSDPTVIATLSKGSMVQQLTVSSGLNTIAIPAQMKETTTYLKFTVSNSNEICLTQTFLYTAPPSCVVYDCFFCLQVFSSVNCLPTSYKMFVVLVLILLFMAILILIPCVYSSLYIIGCCVVNFVKWIMGKSVKRGQWLRNKVSGKVKIDTKTAFLLCICVCSAQLLDQTFDSNEITYFQNPPAPSLDPSVIKNEINFWPCDNFITLSDSTSCTAYSADLQNCDVSFHQTIEFIKSSKICLYFKDDNGFIIGNINFTYYLDVISLSNDFLYETGEYSLMHSSTFGCYGDGWCNSDDCPGGVESRSANSFPSDIAQLPGETFCRRTCQGAVGCGCAIPFSMGCDNYGYGFKSNSFQCDVLEPQTSMTYPLFVIEYNDISNGVIDSRSFAGAVGQNIAGVNFTATLVGEYVPSVPIFENQKFLTCPDGSYFGTAADLNAPIAGSVGDVQANQGNFEQNKFIYANDIVTITSGVQYSSFSTLPNGILSRTNMLTIPNYIGQFYLQSDSILINSQGGSPTIQISNQGSFTITSYVQAACPSFQSVLGSGCYNCQSGSVLLLSASSSCSDAGSVTLSADDINVVIVTKSIDVSSSPSNFLIKILVSTSVVNFNLIGTGSKGDQAKIHVSFAAFQNSTVNPGYNNETDYSSNHPSGWSFPYGWSNFIYGITHGNWWSITLLVISCVVIFVIIIILLKILMNMTKPKIKTF